MTALRINQLIRICVFYWEPGIPNEARSGTESPGIWSEAGKSKAKHEIYTNNVEQLHQAIRKQKHEILLLEIQEQPLQITQTALNIFGYRFFGGGFPGLGILDLGVRSKTG